MGASYSSSSGQAPLLHFLLFQSKLPSSAQALPGGMQENPWLVFPQDFDYF